MPIDDIIVMAMADHGVALYGQAIIANTDFAARQPAAVKGFFSAFLHGLKASMASPARAADAALMFNEALSKDIERERLTMVIASDFVASEVKANGYGGIDAARFERPVNQLALGYRIRSVKPKPPDIFDALCLPPAAERAAR